jgi:thymidine phosphorylase
MLVLAHTADTVDQARATLRKALESGAALEKFRANVEAQGGDPRVCDDPEGVLPLVTQSFHVESPRSGFISSINTSEIGNAVAAIGGGRVRIEDMIDPAVGFIAAAKLGAKVERGHRIGTVYCRDRAAAEVAVERIRNAYFITERNESKVPQLIKEVVNE